MTPTLYLHGGTQKTGTTAIQNFAVKHWDGLRERGLHYGDYAPGVLPPSGHNAGHHELAKAVGGDESSQYTPEDVRGMVARWHDEAEREGLDVFVSVERIYRLTHGEGDWSRRRSSYLERLADLLSDFDVRPVLIFRRPDDYAHSWYHEIVRTRLRPQLPFEEFLRSEDAVGVEYSTQADLFAAAFGSVDCLTFEELVGGEGLVTNFFDRLGRDVRGLAEVGRVRGGLSAPQAAVKNRANARLKRPQARRFMEALDRGVLDEEIRRELGGQKYSLWPSHERRAEYLASRREDLDRLGARHFGGVSGDAIFPPLEPDSTPPALPELSGELAGIVDGFIKGLRFADRPRRGGAAASESPAKNQPSGGSETVTVGHQVESRSPVPRQEPAIRQEPATRQDTGRRLTLHIGAHKTASSLLQATLRRDASTLRGRGLFQVHRQPILKSDFHADVRRLIQGEARQSSLEEGRESFAGLLEDKDGDVLLTNEDFFESFNRPQFYRHIGPTLEHVCEVAGTRDIRVVLYVRSQVDYIESLFMHHIHLGHDRQFDTFLADYLDFDLSWKRVLDDIAGVVGRENVVAIPYEAIKRVGSSAFYRTFLSACGVSETADLEITEDESRDRSANRSYSQDALEIASVVNPLLDKDGRNTLRQFLQRKYSTATHPRAVLVPDDRRQEILARLREDNEQLFAEYLSGWEADQDAYR